MDLLTLHLTNLVLTCRSVREAARLSGRAPSTVSAALARTESAIAAPLVIRQRASLVLTLEAERRAAVFAEVAHGIARILDVAGLPPQPVPPIGIAALTRLSVVAHSGSIRAAARRVGIGQPQLTRQLADLERHLGVVLLSRGSAGSGLTAAGRRLLPHIEAVTAGWEQISRAAAERFRSDITTWRVGTVMPMGHESSISRMLARLAVLWSAQQGRHRLRISSHTADELMLGLKTRRFDLVVLDHARIPADFHSIPVSTNPLALVGHESLMPDDPDIPALLRRHPLALPSAKSGIRQESMAYLARVLGDEALRRLPIAEIDTIPVIINLVAHYGYLSVLPMDSAVRLPFALRCHSLAPDAVQRLVMVWLRAGLPETLTDLLRRAAEEAAAEASSA